MSSSTDSRPQQGGVFERAADFMSYAIGTPAVFGLALFIVVCWAATGPLANFSNTWQLIINTGTTIVTFLMVFLLGNASNRITENQDAMLENIYGEEERVEAEERMIRKLLDRIDVRHIRPILQHLDEQDHQVQALEERIMAAIQDMRSQA
jgi:low affinity Fe/Cu permease